MLSLPLRFHTDLMDIIIMMQFIYQKRSPSQEKIWTSEGNGHRTQPTHHFSVTNVPPARLSQQISPLFLVMPPLRQALLYLRRALQLSIRQTFSLPPER